MRTIKNILSGIIVFMFGLEVGGFGMWYMTMKAIHEPRKYSDEHLKR